MDSWQARFESFSKRKRVKQGSSTTVLKWPHPPTFLATPETLAEAGFYFTPTASTPDAVRCFTCGKELSDWEAQDDPFAEHVRRGNNCCWAVVRCGLGDDMDEDGNYLFPNPARVPSSKIMEKARLESYSSSWPHDRAKGHSASSKKMAQAGFVYTPQGPGDDTATCFYCGTSLSGWEDGDDPREEHRKREEKAQKQCPFFTTTAPQPQRTKPVGRPPSRSSKPSSSTTAKPKKKAQEPQLEDPPSSLSSDEGSNAPTAPSDAKSRASTSKRSSTRASSVAAKTPASRKSTRSASVSRHTATSKAAAASETEDDVEASGSEAGKRVSKSKKKGATKAKERIEVIQEEEEGENAAPEDQPVEPPAPPKKKRGRPPKNKTAATTVDAVLSVPEAGHANDGDAKSAEQPVPSKTRPKANAESESDVPMASSSETKTKSSARGKAKPTPASVNEMPPPSLPSGPSKNTGRKARKVVESDLEEESPDPAPKANLETKSRTKSKGVSTTRGPEVEHENIAEESQARQAVDSAMTKSKNRKSSSTSDDAGYATAEHAMDVDVKPSEHHEAPSTSRRSQEPSHTTFQRSSSIEKAPSRQGSVRPGRSSARPASALIRSTSRLATEVVDISSSDEEVPPPKSTFRHIPTAAVPVVPTPSAHHLAPKQAVPTPTDEILVDEGPKNEKPHLKSNTVRATSRAPSKGARLSRLVVEVVAPPPPSSSHTEEGVSPDVEMADAITPPAANDEGMAPQQLSDDKDTASRQQPEDLLPTRTSPPATPPPRTPSLPPTDTEMSKPSSKPPVPTLPSFDEEMQDGSAPFADDALASFTPFLSMAPLPKLSSLPEEDYDLTLEQYIRREIEHQYQQFKEDAERQIALFQTKAAETRRMLESA